MRAAPYSPGDMAEPARKRCRHGVLRLLLAVAMALAGPSLAAAQGNPLLSLISPKPTPTPAATPVANEPAIATGVAATPEALLAVRLTTIQAALQADIELDSGHRETIEDGLSRLAVTVRALASAAGKLESARARAETQPRPEPVDVNAAFDRWQQKLPAGDVSGELWPLMARLGTEVRAMRRQERDLVTGALAGSAPDNFADRALWAPLPIESLVAALPDEPAHTPALIELARAVEDRRATLVAEIDALSSSPIERIDRLRAGRAALASRIELAQRQIQYVAGELAATVARSVERVNAMARDVLARAPGDSEAAAHANALSELADEVANLHRRDMLLERRAILHADQLDDIVRLADDTRARLAVEGGSRAIGLVLVNDLARTLPPQRLAEELDALRDSLADVQIRLVDLRARIVAANDGHPGEQTSALLDLASAMPEIDTSVLASLHLRLLVMVEAASQAVAAAMRGEEATLAELDRRNRELRTLIAGRLLWTRSHSRIDTAWWTELGARLGSGVALQTPLRSIWRGFADAVGSLRGTSGMIVVPLIAAGWWLLARRQRRRLDAIAKSDSVDLVAAAAAIARALLLAAPLAWLLVASLRAARGSNPVGAVQESLLSGVGWSAWTVLLLVAISVTARARGVGDAVLGWDLATRTALRNAALALLLLILPSQLAVSGAWYRGDLPALQYEARLVFIAAWIGVAIVLWRVLRPGGAWPEWRGLLRRGLRVVLVFAPAAAAVASVLGYQITALAISRQVEGTIGVLGTLLIAHGLAVRGVILSVRRAEEQRAVQAQLANMEGTPAHEPATNLAAEAAHGRRLVGLATAVAGAIGLALLWVELLPALRQLDGIVLWHVSGSNAGDARIAISLLDVLSAVGVAVLVGVALRLMPGLLDAILRERTRIEPGTRYAIGAVVRYAVTIVGVVAVFGLIGVRWAHLQWMAAALTVGLGFGLQEIFANFVSGLILLGERQVRVGDIVTVGDITGRVTKISTRATTVLDFDRREIMIPNKALITDRLVNWSLTSGLTRTTVRIGVAFGTDPALVHRLLREVADQEPKVLTRPEPLTVFMGFGRSNMEFELRVYVPSFDDRETVSNSMYARIASSFPAAGVSIDYEQVEVRLVAGAEQAGAERDGLAKKASRPAP